MAIWTKFNNPHTWGGKKRQKRHIVASNPVPTTEEEQRAIDSFDAVWNTLTQEEKKDIIEVDGKKYVRKIWMAQRAERGTV